MLLSVLVPLFNEGEWVTEALSRVLDSPLPPNVDFEIIVVDDASTADSASRVEELCSVHPSKIRLIRHVKNMGKGAAIQTAIAQARGDFCLFQDADLEYSPNDYPRMLQPLLSGPADCVFGSRFITVGEVGDRMPEVKNAAS
jgi:glycosyltransferase involved in cell wall biosynthesis